MEWPLSQSNDGEKEVAAAIHPSIRLLTVPKKVSDQPLGGFAQAIWVECKPETIGTFSAVGYYFGREIQRRLGVPIGLINSSWGGTTAGGVDQPGGLCWPNPCSAEWSAK